ncbi:3-hydroxyacyl-CoA dehydrogenase family protein, partial [Bacillus altitudinis]|uniref:3-hydroxyacyl-CoA dehydrogenase family protein n=1 Tax=Bacillus altitudinis TaxID=293387 RepID=UPI003B52D519
MNQPIYTLYQPLPHVQTIHAIITLPINHPIAPLPLPHLIPLHTSLFIINTLHHPLGHTKYPPSPLFKKYLNPPSLPKNTNTPFYTYHH